MSDTLKSSPVALFVYKRPKHTRLALESLARNRNANTSELFIYCDGPASIEEIEQVEAVRKIAKSRQWCGSVHIYEHKKNIGLASSVIAGVTEICEKFGRVIVLEDDLIISPYFLEYMNSALDLYEKDSRVMQISGYMFPVKDISADETFFLPLTTSWGWATWQRAWDLFDIDLKKYNELATDSHKIYEFNLNDSYPYFSMLRKQIDGDIDSWAIKWYFTVFTMNGLVLFPSRSLVENIGFDGSGTHGNNTKEPRREFCHRPVNVSASRNTKICNKSLEHLRQYLSSQ